MRYDIGAVCLFYFCFKITDFSKPIESFELVPNTTNFIIQLQGPTPYRPHEFRISILPNGLLYQYSNTTDILERDVLADLPKPIGLDDTIADPDGNIVYIGSTDLPEDQFTYITTIGDQSYATFVYLNLSNIYIEPAPQSRGSSETNVVWTVVPSVLGFLFLAALISVVIWFFLYRKRRQSQLREAVLLELQEMSTMYDSIPTGLPGSIAV